MDALTLTAVTAVALVPMLYIVVFGPRDEPVARLATLIAAWRSKRK